MKKPDEVVKVLEECRDKNGKLDEKKAYLKLIDAFTISLFTAKKLFACHVESGKDLSGEITALQAKAEGARKSAQSGGGELNENFELVKNGQVITEVRKMTKEEIDLTVRRVSPDCKNRHVYGPLPSRALRRPAAAGGHRPHLGPRALGTVYGRALKQPGRQTSPGNAV